MTSRESARISTPSEPTRVALALQDIPISPRAVAMREHFVEHGFYRQSDLEWLLGRPGQSVSIGRDGKAVLRG